MEVVSIIAVTWILTLALLLTSSAWRRWREQPPQGMVPQPGGDVVLVAYVVIKDGRMGCIVNGPNGGYQLSHELYAAAVLTASVVRNADQGLEAGLEVVQRAAMEVLERGT